MVSGGFICPTLQSVAVVVAEDILVYGHALTVGILVDVVGTDVDRRVGLLGGDLNDTHRIGGAALQQMG